MHSIVLILLLTFISELAFSMPPNRPSCVKPGIESSLKYSTMAPDDPIVEEQNGKLMFPVMDPKTGKFTYNLEKGKQIIDERNRKEP